MKHRILFILFTIYQTFSFAQTDRTFWFVAPEVTTSHYDNRYYSEFDTTYRGGEPVFLIFSTREVASDIIITQPANPAFDTIFVSLDGNSTTRLNLTEMGLQSLIENKYENNGFSDHGLLIEATELITAYYEVYTTNNPDLFALKGENALGTEFFVPTQTRAYNHWWTAPWGVRAYHAIDIVATMDNTVISITPTQDVEGGHPANVPYTITLNRGETYSICPEDFSISATSHLAGTMINSSFPIAVTVSDDSVQWDEDLDGSSDEPCYDLQGDQIIPTNIIGTEYIAMRGQLGTGGGNGIVRDQLYILATEDNTDIFINGVFMGRIDAQETYYYKFTDADYSVHVESTAGKPVYAWQVSGFGCEMGGAILPPTSSCTGSNQIGFTRSTSAQFFLNLMVRRNAFDGFELNGTPILTNLTDWTENPSDPNWLSTIIELTNSPLVQPLQQSLIRNTKDIFHMGVINGNATGGCRFGYFSDFNELAVDAIATNSETGNIRICFGEQVRLEAEGGTNFHWTPHEFLDDPYSQNPLCDPRYTTQYTVTVSGACDMTDSAHVVIEVAPEIVSEFSIDVTQACAPHEFIFYDESIGATSNIKWHWGDTTANLTTTDTIAQHEYTNTTDSLLIYEIMLVSKNIESCRDTQRRTVVIYPEINAEFNPTDTIGCHPFLVDFRNSSTGAQEPLPYRWDFGDGASSVLENPSHTFNNLESADDTTYTVELIVQNRYACSDTIEHTVTVKPYIDADFTFTPEESCTPFDVTIENATFGVDTYEWNMGDGSPILNTSDSAFNHLYNNFTDSTIVRTISLAASNEEGCTDTVEKMITIHPAIAADFTPSVTIGCDSLVVSFTNNSLGAAENKWDFGDGASSLEISPTHVFRNFSGDDTVFVVELVVIADNLLCSDTIRDSITVHPFIQANYTYSPSAGCTPHTVDITNTSIGVDTYLWDFGDGTPTSDTSAGAFTHEYSNNTSAGINYTLSLHVENNEGCTDDIDRTITVYPNIVSDFIPNADNICDSTEVIFTNISNGATLYTWDFGDGASSSEVSPNHVFRNLTTADVTYEIRLIAMAENFLCADTSFHSIVVHPYIDANFAIDPINGCTPYNAQFSNTSEGVDTYAWDFGDGETSDTMVASFVHLYTNTTNAAISYTATLTVSNNEGCSSIQSKTLEIYPKVTAAFQIEDGCSPVIINDFQNTSVNATSYNWEFGDGSSSNIANPAHTYVNQSITTDTTFDIRLIAMSDFQCSDTLDTVLSVYASPHAELSISDPVGCPPYVVTVTNQAEGYTSILWNFGEGSGDFNWDVPSIPVQYTNNSNSTITYTTTQIVYNGNGCTDTIQRNTVVYPQVRSHFIAQSGCHPLQITDFQNSSIGGTIYNWTFGDGTDSNEEDPSHTFTTPSRTSDTTYTINLHVESPSGCDDDFDTTISVYHKPLAEFDVSSATGCSPYQITITNEAQGAGSYNWDYGDGTSDANTNASFTYDYYNSTNAVINFPIELITSTTRGCSDTVTHNAVVYPDIKAQFIATSGCHPHTIDDFQNTTIGASSYAWDFGDGITSNSDDPSHIFRNDSYISDTSFTIQLIATSLNDCKDTLDTIISIHPKPFAEFSIQNAEGCSPHTIDIDNLSEGGDSLVWNFGDGTTVSNATTATLNHLYQNATGSTQQFDLTLEVYTNYGCSDTLIRTSNIHSDIIANFSIESGCHPHFVSDFQNTTIGADIYNWTFGDGESSNEESPSHMYNNYSNIVDSVYQVKLVARSIHECIDSIDTLITIYPKPLAEFSINNTPGCSPYNTEFTNLSSGTDSIFWDFGDGESQYTMDVAVTHLYNNDSSIMVNYPVTFYAYTDRGCSDTIIREAGIYPNISAEFIIESGCDPLEVTNFTNTSEGVYIYQWTFGDGETSSSSAPSHTFRNYSRTDDSVYTVHLITESIYGCTAEYDTTITVYHKPQAVFEFINTPVCSPDTVFMTNNSQGQDTCYWNFGDTTGDTTNLETSQQHYYQHSGDAHRVFPVDLIVVTENGCTDEVSHGATVYPDINAEFTVDAYGCSPHNVSFVNSSTGVEQYEWDFGDDNQGTQQSPSHTYHNYSHTIDSVHEVTLITTSQYGCTDTADTVITVFPNPLSEFAILNSPGCSPYDIEIESQSEGAATIYWNFGDGETDFDVSNETFTHNYQHSNESLRIYTIQQVTISQNACRDTITHQATIYPDITSEFTVELGGCNPLSVQVTNNSTGQLQNNWNFGDGSIENSLNPSHTYYNFSNTEPQDFTITLETVSQYGCTATSDTVITVYPVPQPTIDVVQNDQCSPSVVNISNTSVGATSFEWDFGDGSPVISSASSSLDHTYRNQGRTTQTYEIRLVVENTQGCKDTTYEIISVHPEVHAAFSGDFEGCSPLEVNFQNNSDLADYFEWELVPGDITPASTPDHFYVNNSRGVEYNPVQLVARSQFNCKDTAYDTVVVYPSPVADFDPDPIRQIFPKATSTNGAQVNFIDKTNHSGYWSYHWDFGDNENSSTAGDVTHYYQIWNETPTERFTVRLRVENEEYNCFDTISRKIYIASPAPEPRFTTDTTNGCPELTVRFFNQSAYANSYHWDFGDGEESTDENPVHIFRETGKYTVTFTITGDGGSASTTMPIEVYEEPIAYFEERNDKHLFEIPRDTTQLLNLSSFATRYHWDFGDEDRDNDTSSAASPSYLYENPGEFLITLTAYTEHDCTDESTYDVSVIPLCNIQVPDAFTPALTGPTGGNTQDYNYGLNDVFLPAILEEGIDNYHFEIFNKWGEKVFYTENKVVGWDGYYEGELSPVDVYTWKINSTCYGKSIDMVGNVTLLK